MKGLAAGVAYLVLLACFVNSVMQPGQWLVAAGWGAGVLLCLFVFVADVAVAAVKYDKRLAALRKGTAAPTRTQEEESTN